MKTITQELPMAQKHLIIHALELRERQLQEDLEYYKYYIGKDLIDTQNELQEIKVLKKMLQYKVDVVFNENQHKHFNDINGVELPTYIIAPKIVE